MSRREKPDTRPIAGILLVDKPAGSTSNRVLQRAKRLFRARKAGHTGTLDPMATGMLPICFGQATRVSGLMLEARKRYRVTARFGSATDTGDASGNVVDRRETVPVSEPQLAEAVRSMVGALEQIPPMYSAVRHEGRRLYELARAGREVERRARGVVIHEFRLESLSWPQATLFVECSKGTYVRTLVEDLAARVDALAHVETLRRLGVGPFEESQMVTLETLEAAAGRGDDELDGWLLGVDTALLDRPAVTLGEADCAALRHGRIVPYPGSGAGQSVRLYGPDGSFIGLGETGPGGLLRPWRIFNA